MKKNRKKGRKEESIKERVYPEINLYDPRGHIIGRLGQGESIDYQELLLNKLGVIKRKL